jgi:hypothetical protein
MKLIELCKYTANGYLGDSEDNYDPAFSTAQELVEESK